MITIKKASLNDLIGLSSLFDAYRIFYEQPSDIELAKRFLSERMENNESHIFLASWQENLCGFTQLYRTFSSVSAQHSWILNDLFVDPTYRAKGIGEALLKKAQQFAIEDTAKGLALETAKDNPAQKLYERLGWQLEDEYLHYFWKAK